MSRATFPEAFLARIQGFQHAVHDITPIIPTLEEIVWNDNADGLMAGTDKDGRDLVPLAESTLKRRKGAGPPLIPRWRLSRFIANYRVTSIQKGSPSDWDIIGVWMNILSKTGVPFAEFHFEGRGRLPQRDLRGVRPAGQVKMQEALTLWLMMKLEGGGTAP